MALKKLKPIDDDPEEYAMAAKVILDVIKREIYLPLIKELNITQKTIFNSLDDLNEAIKAGRISYYRGKFSGQFSATTSKELKKLGARWNSKLKTWDLPMSALPVETKNAILLSRSTFNETLRRITDKIKRLSPKDIADKIDLTKAFDTSLFKTEQSFKKTMKSIMVPPTISPRTREKIASEYTENMNLYITKFLEKEVTSLRKKVEESAFAGLRYENLTQTIRDSYGVSDRKAEFLARQETNLLLAKYKEARYTEIGIDRYEWRCVVGSSAHPVRPMHKIHDGKIFRWDKPPVVDEQGNRKNPGEDYNCRCVAVPVVEIK